VEAAHERVVVRVDGQQSDFQTRADISMYPCAASYKHCMLLPGIFSFVAEV
jgi:hypothetical protein